MKNNRIAVCADLMMQREYGLCFKLWLSLSTIHTLVIGPSGSGKSIFLKFFLHNLLYKEKVKMYFFDFKNSDDFKFLEGHSNYSISDGCIDGLTRFYEEFKQA
uniref:FtsK/SpoIIIE domain-containing protein n=1 Tax=uncultured Eubacterium sp. TaxID=165185 RepID=UPI003264C86A